MTEGTGYALDGDSAVTKGQDYRFTVNLNYGYRKGSNFKVLVNNVELAPTGEFYVVSAVSGDIVVTVEGVEPIPESYWIVLDGDVDSAEYTAATLLQKYLLQMTDIDYQMVSFADLQIDSGCNVISVGNNGLFAISRYSSINLVNEDFALLKDGKTFYICGSGRGILYGSYRFLRENGCEFYAKGVETIPSDVTLNTNLNLVDAPDFAIRAYLSYNTCYSGTDSDLVTKLGQNSSYASNVSAKYGDIVRFGYIGADTHNMRFYIDDDYNSANGSKYWGTMLCPSADVVGAYTPCLTNGIDYNLTDINTLGLATARMKQLILANPDIMYFTFEQEDGNEGTTDNPKHPYCMCENCVKAAKLYNRSGVMLRFIQAMLNNLRADSELVGREFKIITFAYGYSTTAPIGGVTVDKDLCIWYAAWGDMRYSLSDSKQMTSIRTDYNAWIVATTGDDNGSLILWLYDVCYNNYIKYFGTTMTAIDQIVDEAKAAGVEMILVLGAYDADNIWQSEMRNYVWSRKLTDSSLSAVTLRDNFVRAYFGATAADYVIGYINDYDGYLADQGLGYEVVHGTEYMRKVTLKEHVASLKRIDNAIAAVANDGALTAEQKAIYTVRLQGVRASTYSALMCYWESEYSKTLLASSEKSYVGGSLEEIQNRFKVACAVAGITRCREGTDADNTVDNFITDPNKCW